MPRKIILPIAISLVLLSVAGFMITNYINQTIAKERSAVMEEAKKRVAGILAEQVAVLIAKKDLPKDAVIDQASAEAVTISGRDLAPQAVSVLDRINGMIVLMPIAKGEQITMNKLMSRKEAFGGGTLATSTPIGKRAVTISLDGISALGGMLRPNDTVDIVATIAIPFASPDGKQVNKEPTVLPLFQNVLVLAVGSDLGAVRAADSRYKQPAEQPKDTVTITFALTSQEASLLAFVQEQGSRIRLSLRSPTDSKVEQMQPARWDTLFQYIMPEMAQAPAKKEEAKHEEAKGEFIEIYRGLNKDKIAISDK